MTTKNVFRRGLVLASLATIFLALPDQSARTEPASEDSGSSAESSGSSEGREGRGGRARRFRPGLGQASATLAGKPVRIAYGKAWTTVPAFQKIESMKPGEIVTFLNMPSIKLRTEADLKFGDKVFKTGNITKNYPGIYSLWIKKAEEGWRLVFNSEGDVWGTQHNPEADTGEVPLTFAKTEANASELSIEIKAEEGNADNGLLKISWGPYEWSAKFGASAPEPSEG